jgi:ADP-ribose pyrophosphatase YjhB (NUDIX family)
MPETELMEIIRRLQTIAQSGLTYCKNPFDLERYHEIQVISVKLMAIQSGEPIPAIKDLFEKQAGYATPKVDCRGVVMKDGKLLLVRELSDGGYTLPGGWVDIGEPLSMAVEREVREEAGWVVKAKRLLAVYDRDLHGHPPYIFHAYKLFVECEPLEPTQADVLETADPEFFDPAHIPALSIERTTTEEVERLVYLCAHPDLPADFD